MIKWREYYFGRRFDGKRFTEVLSVLGINQKEVNHQQKWRDLLKSTVIKSNDTAVFVLIGIENQSDIHYAMPVKSMLYDALNYGSQVNEASKEHKKKRDYASSAEFLSGFAKNDRLTPVIPITLYLGADKWDAPVSLHEMFAEMDKRLKSFVPDYRIILVSPEGMEKADLYKLQTDLKEFLGAIKYSENQEKFNSFIMENPKFKALDNKTVEAINIFTGAGIKMNRKAGKTDMCKAIKDMQDEYMQKGMEKGKEEGVKEGMIVLVETLKELGQTNDVIVSQIVKKYKLTEEEARKYI